MPAGIARVVAGGSVPFEEYLDSPTIGLRRRDRTVKRKGRILWSQIDALAAECYPAIPAVYGRHPVLSYLYVSEIDIKPFHPSAEIDSVAVVSGVLAHEYAEIEVSYAPLDEVENITRKWSFGGEFMTLPSHSLEWEDIPGAPVQEEEISAAKIIPSIEHSITIPRLAAINWDALRDMIGKVNDGEFEKAADQTLLFSGAEISFRVNQSGAPEYTKDLKFQERCVKQGNDKYGWNHFLRKDGQWKKLKDKGGNLIYPITNKFADLFL